MTIPVDHVGIIVELPDLKGRHLLFGNIKMDGPVQCGSINGAVSLKTLDIESKIPVISLLKPDGIIILDNPVV